MRISEIRETTEDSAELEFRIQFPPADSPSLSGFRLCPRKNVGFLPFWRPCGAAASAETRRVFEVTDSGFIIFAGTPGKPNCFGQSVAALARQYGGLNAAAEALGYPSVRALQKAILEFCEPDEAAEHRKNNAGQSNSISP